MHVANILEGAKEVREEMKESKVWTSYKAPSPNNSEAGWYPNNETGSKKRKYFCATGGRIAENTHQTDPDAHTQLEVSLFGSGTLAQIMKKKKSSLGGHIIRNARNWDKRGHVGELHFLGERGSRKIQPVEKFAMNDS